MWSVGETLVGVVPAEEGADNGEEDKHKVEGVPTLLDGIGFEKMVGECVQRGKDCGNYDQRECKCNHQNAYQNRTGAEKQRVRSSEAAVATVLRPEVWWRVFFFFRFHLVFA